VTFKSSAARIACSQSASCCGSTLTRRFHLKCPATTWRHPGWTTPIKEKDKQDDSDKLPTRSARKHTAIAYRGFTPAFAAMIRAF